MSRAAIRYLEPIETPSRGVAVLDALAGINPDQLSPRDAQEALYRLRALLDGG